MSPQPRPGPEGVGVLRPAGGRCWDSLRAGCRTRPLPEGAGSSVAPSQTRGAASVRRPWGLPLLSNRPPGATPASYLWFVPLDYVSHLSGKCTCAFPEVEAPEEQTGRDSLSPTHVLLAAGDVPFVRASDTRLGAGRAARGAARTKTGWEGPRRALRCEGEGEESSPRRFVDGRLVGRRCGGWQLPSARPEASRRKHAGVSRVQRHVATFS